LIGQIIGKASELPLLREAPTRLKKPPAQGPGAAFAFI